MTHSSSDPQPNQQTANSAQDSDTLRCPKCGSEPEMVAKSSKMGFRAICENKNCQHVWQITRKEWEAY